MMAAKDLPRAVDGVAEMLDEIAALKARVADLEACFGRPRNAEMATTMAGIAKAAAIHYGLSLVDLRGRSRLQRVSHARQEAMAGMRAAGFSLNQIGRYLDGRDHHTVSHGIEAHYARCGAAPNK
jgi:chromosomal replication initiation ATPase DnaA